VVWYDSTVGKLSVFTCTARSSVKDSLIALQNRRGGGAVVPISLVRLGVVLLLTRSNVHHYCRLYCMYQFSLWLLVVPSTSQDTRILKVHVKFFKFRRHNRNAAQARTLTIVSRLRRIGVEGR
jgi:hypothetical protein